MTKQDHTGPKFWEKPARPDNQMTTKNLVWFFVGLAIFFGLIILVILANMPDVTNAQP